ncbi:MAG: hypothetical protein IJ893_07335 [Bacteroidales bacterium]|nr:hypothetical protein [Bacteroidales bacterium]
MKQFFNSIMLVAAAAMAFSACNKATDTSDTGKTVEAKTIRFSAFVNEDEETKATLTTNDDKSFFANWEVGDRMWVRARAESNPGTTNYLGADWDGRDFVSNYDALFISDIPSTCQYRGIYPAGAIKLSPYRTQIGNEYNSLYDPMIGYATYENAIIGENPDGGNVVIPMDRQTSILYFHLTSDLDERITSATLTVEGGAIAADEIKLDNDAMETIGSTYNSIVITYPKGMAPSARDFRLWYNIIPVEATSLTLTVTTDTKVATIRNTKGKTYVAGKINKIVKNGLAWTDDPNAVETLSIAQFIEKPVGDPTFYKLTGTVENTPEANWIFHLNDGTGSVLVDGLMHSAFPDYSELYFQNGDEVTLIGRRGEEDGKPAVWMAEHFSHVFVPHLTVSPILVFESDEVGVRKQVEFYVDRFDSVVYITIEPMEGSDSKFSVEGHSIYPKMENTDEREYAEVFSITAFDGKNTLQKQFEVRQKGLGLSGGIDVTFNGYNEEIDF